MGDVLAIDSGYVNSPGGKYKISCLVLGAIGLLACNLTRIYAVQYNSAAGAAFVVTLILLILLICIAPIRTSSIFLKIEILVCVILCICYVVGSINIFRACWYWLFDNFQAGPFIGSLVATICSILATLTYAYDAIYKFREAQGGSSTSNV